MLNIQELLSSPRTIAVVGLSPDRSRASNSVSRYLIGEGFTIIPVNPNHEEILGLACYPDLVSIPAEVSVQIVAIFRQPNYTADVVRDLIRRIESTKETPVVWTQIGVSSQDAASLARTNGLEYVSNRCLLVEHQRYARSTK